MSVKENKALVRRYFEEAPHHSEVCSQIFAPHVMWHAMYRTDQPDFISDPETEKVAYTRHKALWGAGVNSSMR